MYNISEIVIFSKQAIVAKLQTFRHSLFSVCSVESVVHVVYRKCGNNACKDMAGQPLTTWGMLEINSYGSSLMILAVKLYEAAVESLRKRERQDETQFTTKIDGFPSFIPPWMLMYFFAFFFFGISPCVWPNSGFWCCVFLTLRIPLLCWESL